MSADASSPVDADPPRNLVLCFDGTGDWIGQDRTNVAKIFTALDEDPLLCYYDGGIGTLADYHALSALQRLALRYLDLATATSLRNKVLQGYLFLVRNYRPGDRVYLFGFSRGAYTARLLAAMVHSYGLLRRSAENIAPYLWQSFSAGGAIEGFKDGAERLQKDFSLAVPVSISFMGLFDTVSSVGVVTRFNVYPYTSYNPSVERTCHAVSIEESRNTFPENLMRPYQQNLTEVWFPGVHRDAGGGVPPNRSRIADEALHFIVTEAKKAGLAFDKIDPPDATCPPTPNYPPFDPYVVAGLWPMRMFARRLAAFRFYWPNLRHVRIVPDDALVHEIAEIAYGSPLSATHPPNYPRACRIFRTGDDTRSHRSHAAPEVRPSVPDFFAALIGVTVLLMIWNAAVGSPLGSSMANGRAWIEVVLFSFFLLAHGIGKATLVRLPTPARRLCEWAPSTAGLLMLLAAPIVYGASPLLFGGFLAGLVAWGTAQLGPWPVIRSDRVLPYFLFAGIASAFAVRLGGFALPDLLRPAPPKTITIAVLAITAVLALLAMFRDRPEMRAHQERPDEDGFGRSR